MITDEQMNCIVRGDIMIDKDLFQRLEENSYTEEELNEVINLIWALEDDHPSFFSGVARKLIVTMMRDRHKVIK